MALLVNAKKGREDGGYTRLFGETSLGALLSQVQGTLISAGTELEKLIMKYVVNTFTLESFDVFLLNPT